MNYETNKGGCPNLAVCTNIPDFTLFHIFHHVLSGPNKQDWPSKFVHSTLSILWCIVCFKRITLFKKMYYYFFIFNSPLISYILIGLLLSKRLLIIFVVADFLFIVTPIVGIYECSMFFVRYFMSILVLQLS